MVHRGEDCAYRRVLILKNWKQDIGSQNDLIFQTDPFHTVHLLSEEEKETARRQTIPSLLNLLQLAKNHSISLIFDLYSSGEKDAEIVVQDILNSGIDQQLVSPILCVDSDEDMPIKNIVKASFSFHRFTGYLERTEATRSKKLHVSSRYTKIKVR